MAEQKNEHTEVEQTDATEQTQPAAEELDEQAAAADAADDTETDAEELGEDDLAAVVSQLQEDIATAHETVLRAQADAQNAQRRAAQDVEKARKFALERFAGELLPVVDNLERALQAAPEIDETVKPIIEGVELTLKSFHDALRKFNVEPVDPEGEPFDPEFHQAMSMVENPDAEPNSVLTVVQKGYTLNGRLVRPAMVVVSKAKG